MEPETENPAEEQGYRPSTPGTWPFEGLFESEEEAVEFRATINRWRDEDRRQTNS